MIKIIKTVVNTNRMLIGFLIEAKDRELGGLSDEKVQKALPLNVFTDRGFENNQMSFRGKHIIEKGQFKINELPMLVLANNKLVPVGNKMTLIQRFVQDEKTVGFGVEFSDNSKCNYAYDNIVRLSSWFKPSNFSVRTTADGKRFLYGKPGQRLSDLPTTELGNSKGAKNPKNKTERAKDTANGAEKTSVKAESPKEEQHIFTNAVDIIDIYEGLEKCDGIVLKLPQDKYLPTGKVIAKTDNEFSSLGIGEYAYPTLSFHEIKLNANTNFRRPGVVNVNFEDGVNTPVNTFVFSTGNIFFDGDNYIDRLGIAIPEYAEEQFLDAFAKTASIRPIDNNLITEPIRILLNRHDLQFYELNTNKVDLIDESKYSKYILGTKELYGLVDSLFIPRAICKYLSPKTGLINELKKKLKVNYKESTGKKIFGEFETMSQAYLQRLTAAGIDIYSGNFNRTVKVTPSEEKMNQDLVARINDDLAVSIEYCIEGKEIKKWTYKLIKDRGAKGIELPQEVIKVVQRLESMPDNIDKLKIAHSLYNRYDRVLEQLKKELWLHKCAMYMSTNKERIHQHDKDNWELDTTRKTRAKYYKCTVPECNKLMVAVINTEID